MPRGFAKDTGAGVSAASPDTTDDELEQIWDRLTGQDPKRLPPPTPPPGSLTATMFTAARPVPPDARKPNTGTPAISPSALAGAPPHGLSLDSPTPVGLPLIG